MSDTRKDFEQAMKAKDYGHTNFIMTNGKYNWPMTEECYQVWQACQQLNDKRIADLLALVAKKDEALNLIHREHGLATALDALALTVDDVELVKLPILFMGEPAYSIKNKS